MDVQVSSIKYAYVLGRLESLLKENEWKNLSWADLERLAEGKTNSTIDQLKIDAAEMSFNTKFRGLADDIKDGLYQRLSQSTSKRITEAAVRGQIKDTVKLGVEMQRSYQEVARNLVNTLKETKRNWVRVAATEMHAAHQNGVVAAILQGDEIYEGASGEDSQVAVVHDADVCADCRRLYIDPKTGHPKIFVLKELLANEGSNYQKPWRQNAGPVVPPLHPHCNGRIRYVPTGWGWNDKGKFTVIDFKAAYPEDF
jgi:hypothetical protein